MMHKLLRRQLERFRGTAERPPKEWEAFLAAIGEAYEQAEKDYALLERSLELTSQELVEINAELRKDIADRKRAERNRLLMQATNDVVYDRDIATGRVVWNGALHTVLGYRPDEFGPEILDGLQWWKDHLHPEDKARVLAAFQAMMARRGDVWKSEYRFQCADGTYALIVDRGLVSRDADGAPLRMIGSMADISDLRKVEEALQKAQEQLRQMQKLDAIGRLAGGVAHDFNNILTAIKGYTYLLTGAIPPEDPKREDLKQIDRASDRAAALTGRLLTFSRKQVVQARTVEVNTLVKEMQGMLRRLINEDIELSCELGPDTGNIRGDPSQLEQVVMNLVINARDAMPQGGRLQVRTRSETVRERRVGEHDSIPPGPYAVLVVADTGIGMDDATRSHLFEPFFTTKGIGRGTGLGLSTVYGIVKQAEGFLRVVSEPGRGSTFEVYLPRVLEEVPESKVEAGAVGKARLSGRVLVVEDEEMLRSLLPGILIPAGFDVLVASGAEEAVRLAETTRGSIDLLLTDVVMPGQNGRELAEKLTARRPRMKVLYMSGYSHNVLADRGIDEDLEFIQKPFSPETLIRRVRDLIEGSPARHSERPR